MAQKKDFMSALAEEVAAKKRGERTDIDGINNFVSKRHLDQSEEDSDQEEEIHTVDEDHPVGKPASAEEDETQQDDESEAQEEYDSDDGSPASFGKEEFIRYDKPKKKLSKGGKAVLIIAAAAIVFAIYWFGFAPHIVLPDFVSQGSTLDDVSNWARQQQISSSAIATNAPQYSLDFKEGVVMAQDPAGGTKVKKDTPITLTVSAGPNPDEKIEFPDLASMNQDEINTWISDNQLLKTKVTTEYSDTVADGSVISYDLKNVDPSDFTRGTALTIKVSKGTAPAGQITVTDFTGKTAAEAETWAKNKKLEISETQSFSDKAAEGTIISQSPSSGTNMSEGDTFTIVVSKGKGVAVPDLVGYTKDQLSAWTSSPSNSGVTIITTSVYNSAAEGTVIAQKTAPGTVVGSGDVLEITTSLYLPIIETTTDEWIGKNYMELKAKCDEFNSNGADIQAGEWDDMAERAYSDTVPKDGIIEYACLYGTSDQGNGCERPLNVNSRIKYRVSLGPAPSADPSKSAVTLTDENVSSLDAMKSWCRSSTNVSCVFDPQADESLPAGSVRVTINDSIVHTSSDVYFNENIAAGSSVKISYGPYSSPAAEPSEQADQQ